MASKKNRARASKDAAPRKYKKKTSPLVIEKVEYVDYKDVDLLSRFMSDRAKIRNRRVTRQRRPAAARRRQRDQDRPRDGAAAVRQAGGQPAHHRPPRDGRPPRSDDAAPTLATSPGPAAADEAALDTGTPSMPTTDDRHRR